MSNDQGTKSPTEMTNEELSDEIKRLNAFNGTSAHVTGNKDELLASYAEANVAVSEKLGKDDLVARAAGLNVDITACKTKADIVEAIEKYRGTQDVGAEPDGTSKIVEAASVPPEVTETIEQEIVNDDGDVVATVEVPAPHQGNILGAALLGVMTGPTGQPLPQLHPEPADVAGEQETGADTTRDAALAARELADAQVRSGVIATGQPAGSEGRQASLEEEAPHYAAMIAEDNYSERIMAWADANPEATVIPPALLPPAYRDGNIVTAGIPPLSYGQADVEEE